MAVAVARTSDCATLSGRVSPHQAAQRRHCRNAFAAHSPLKVLTALILSVASAAVFAQSGAVNASALAQRGAAAGLVSRNAPNIAFFSGNTPPVDALQAFDSVVLDPSTGFEPAAHPLAHTAWIARARSPAGAGGATSSSDAFIASVIAPLWDKGYRGFLLDTPSAIGAAERIHTLHPDARLIIGGPNALQAAAPYTAFLYAVVGDALIQGLTPGSSAGSGSASLSPVPEALRSQRTAAARAFTAHTGVTVVSEEFCATADRQCARDTASKVLADGVTPYVTRPGEDIVGIGRIEVQPRKVLIVQDAGTMDALDISPGVRNVAMPLNYLGYDVEYADMNTLPADLSPDRYAGVVVWLEGDTVPNELGWQSWVAARIGDHVPVAFFGHFGFDAATAAGSTLDMQPVGEPLAAPISEVKRDPMVGFEIDPKPDVRDLQPIRVGSHSRALLTLSANGTLVDEVAVTPWGGYALSPYTVVWVDGIEQKRWAVQPLEFLQAALQLPALPSPSVTTENGRRLLMSHVDGDGFASRAEFPGADYSGQALYDRIFSHYPVPMALSVIEGEVGPDGLHPAISPRLEQIARAMFALPNVEIGSHTYSHPFIWQDVDTKSGTQDDGGGDAAFSLNIPGYHFNLDREISGSLQYIDSRLAPPGKKADLLQWSGNCRPPAVAIRRAYEAGVYNLNGGDTMITRSANTWTYIAPIGIDKGPGAYQVYAPNQDENVYTTNWQGPYYGFTRVLETFAMTDAPYRFKPIDIYYHMYSGTKLASLRALDEIFTAVLKQPVMPIYVNEYIRKVLDWRSFAVAREIAPDNGTGQVASAGTAANAVNTQWIVRGNGSVRELHWPQNGAPTLAPGNGVTGFSHGPDGTYIHIADGAARFSIGSGGDQGNAADARGGSLPYIAEADGEVRHFSRTATGMRFDFAGHYQPFVKFANAQTCRVTVNGQAVSAQRDGEMLRFDTPASVEQQMNFKSVELTCGR